MRGCMAGCMAACRGGHGCAAAMKLSMKVSLAACLSALRFNLAVLPPWPEDPVYLAPTVADSITPSCVSLAICSPAYLKAITKYTNC